MFYENSNRSCGISRPASIVGLFFLYSRSLFASIVGLFCLYARKSNSSLKCILLASSRFRGLALMDTDLWKRTCEIDSFRTISCGNSNYTRDCSKFQFHTRLFEKNRFRKFVSESRRVMGSRGKNVRVPCDWLFWTPILLAFRTQQGPTRRRLLLTLLTPVVEGKLPLLLIYYRLIPISGWRVIEPPGNPHLQGSFQTTNTKETLTATFLLHVSKSSDAVKTKSCGLEDTAQERPKKEQNPNQQLAKPNTIR